MKQLYLFRGRFGDGAVRCNDSIKIKIKDEDLDLMVRICNENEINITIWCNKDEVSK